MALQVQGNSGTIAEVETNTRAHRVTQRPTDIGALGAYAMSLDNGATVITAGLAAASEIYQFRWTSTNLCLLRSVRISMGSVVAFVAGRLLFEAVMARSFTAAGTGGTAATLSGSNQRKRTSFATTLLGEARIITTVALGAGTKTLDAQGFGNIAGGCPTTVGNILSPQCTLWERNTADEYPIVFAQNEGFAIRATVPGTGTWYVGVTVEWGELATF